MHPKPVKDLVTRAGQKEVEMAPLSPSPSPCKMVIRMYLHRSLSVPGRVLVVGVVEGIVGVVRPAHRNLKPS